jgi:hypothetical protein
MAKQHTVLEKYLKQGKSITPRQALDDPDIRSFRLGAIIYDLRKEGYKIKTEINKDGAHYAIYSLEQIVDEKGQMVLL